MSGILQQKKQRILKRLENTIEAINSITYEINTEIEGIIENNAVLVKTAEMYNHWISKQPA